MFDLLSREDRGVMLWYTPWRLADKDWLTHYFGSSEEVALSFFMNISRHKLLKIFGVSDVPISSQLVFNQWADFPYELYWEALSLAGCIATLSQEEISDERYDWASRFSKALYTSSWGVDKNQPSQKIGLLLLKHWLGEACWQRVRLSFPKKMVIDLEKEEALEVPYRRLNTMWRAVFCYLLDSEAEQ